MQQSDIGQTCCGSSFSKVFLQFSKNFRLVKFRINRFAFRHSNMNGGTPSCKKYGIHYLLYTDGPFCNAWSFARLCSPNLVLVFSFWLIKMNPCFVTSDDICKRPCIVIWILFKQQFGALHTSLFLLICQQMGDPSSTDLRTNAYVIVI